MRAWSTVVAIDDARLCRDGVGDNGSENQGKSVRGWCERTSYTRYRIQTHCRLVPGEPAAKRGTEQGGQSVEYAGKLVGNGKCECLRIK